MKKYVILLLLTVGYFQVRSQELPSTKTLEGDVILGVWQTSDQKAQITISRKDSLYNGKLSNATLNIDNKLNLNLPTGLFGIYILRDFRFAGSNRWDGTIYDPKSRDSYKCYLKLSDDGTMKVRGYKGISLFGKSQIWRRLN